jgi:hypothetical protein
VTKYILPFFGYFLKLALAILAYGFLMHLLGLIHPLVPAFVMIAGFAGLFAWFKVKDAEHEAEMAQIRAKTDESLAKLRGTLFPVESDHTQASDDEDDDAPLVRYSEHDPVQRI